MKTTKDLQDTRVIKDIKDIEVQKAKKDTSVRKGMSDGTDNLVHVDRLDLQHPMILQKAQLLPACLWVLSLSTCSWHWARIYS
jgi:hypothetical protein